MAELSERDRAILQFETDYPVWQYQGAKEDRVRELFDVSFTRYFQIRNHLLDQPEALAAFPTTVRRLTRLREQRRAVRNARIRLGSSHDPRGYDRQPGPQGTQW